MLAETALFSSAGLMIGTRRQYRCGASDCAELRVILLSWCPSRYIPRRLSMSGHLLVGDRAGARRAVFTGDCLMRRTDGDISIDLVCIP
jgi:hypothetical protein